MAGVTKITTKVWRPALTAFNERIESACLRRDAYIGKLLETEIAHLENEMPLSNSAPAAKFIADRLSELDRDTLTLAIPSSLSLKLTELCRNRNIVRDAFFNRLIFLLAATPQQIDTLFFDGTSDWHRDVQAATGPYDIAGNDVYPLSSPIDPFWAIRIGLECYRTDVLASGDAKNACGDIKGVVENFGDYQLQDGIYSTTFKGRWTDGSLIGGLNCWLPDWLLPNSEESANRKRRLDELALTL